MPFDHGITGVSCCLCTRTALILALDGPIESNAKIKRGGWFKIWNAERGGTELERGGLAFFSECDSRAHQKIKAPYLTSIVVKD